jgi:hypothetical protein
MSAEEKKVAAVARITGDLSSLNATKFELVAHALLREVEGIPFAHRGLSTNQNPAGYTVDSLSLGGSVIGEYGTADDYFSAPFDKIRGDVKHALGASSLVRRLSTAIRDRSWLINRKRIWTTRRCTPCWSKRFGLRNSADRLSSSPTTRTWPSCVMPNRSLLLGWTRRTEMPSPTKREPSNREASTRHWSIF